jgi:hypothetical protein
VKLSERLLERLRDESPFEIPVTAAIERTYVGRWQAMSGAYRWYLVGAGFEIGSEDTMAECVRATSLNFRQTIQKWHGQWEVDAVT